MIKCVYIIAVNMNTLIEPMKLFHIPTESSVCRSHSKWNVLHHQHTVYLPQPQNSSQTIITAFSCFMCFTFPLSDDSAMKHSSTSPTKFTQVWFGGWTYYLSICWSENRKTKERARREAARVTLNNCKPNRMCVISDKHMYLTFIVGK